MLYPAPPCRAGVSSLPDKVDDVLVILETKLCGIVALTAEDVEHLLLLLRSQPVVAAIVAEETGTASEEQHHLHTQQGIVLVPHPIEQRTEAPRGTYRADGSEKAALPVGRQCRGEYAGSVVADAVSRFTGDMTQAVRPPGTGGMETKEKGGGHVFRPDVQVFHE